MNQYEKLSNTYSFEDSTLVGCLCWGGGLYVLDKKLFEKSITVPFENIMVKMWIAVYLVSHTFDIAMAVFDIGQSVVNSSSGIIRGNTAMLTSALDSASRKMAALLECMSWS